MTSLTLPVQDAVFAALNVTAVTNLAPVYQHPPDDAEPPMVVIGDMSAEPMGAKDSPLDRVTVEILTLYRGPDREGMMLIQGEVRAALDGVLLSDPRIVPTVMMFDGGDAPEVSDDGLTYGGIQRFAAIVQPA